MTLPIGGGGIGEAFVQVGTHQGRPVLNVSDGEVRQKCGNICRNEAPAAVIARKLAIDAWRKQEREDSGAPSSASSSTEETSGPWTKDLFASLLLTTTAGWLGGNAGTPAAAFLSGVVSQRGKGSDSGTWALNVPVPVYGFWYPFIGARDPGCKDFLTHDEVDH